MGIYKKTNDVQCENIKCRWHDGFSEPDEDGSGDGTCDCDDGIRINSDGECMNATDITFNQQEEG